MSVLHSVVLPLVNEVKTAIDMLPFADGGGITDPYVPGSNTNDATIGLGKGFKIVTGLLLFAVIGVAVLMTIWTLGKAAWSDRTQIRDASKPFTVFLLASAFSAVVQVIWGVFNPIVTAMS